MYGMTVLVRDHFPSKLRPFMYPVREYIGVMVWQSTLPNEERPRCGDGVGRQRNTSFEQLVTDARNLRTFERACASHIYSLLGGRPRNQITDVYNCRADKVIRKVNLTSVKY